MQTLTPPEWFEVAVHIKPSSLPSAPVEEQEGPFGGRAHMKFESARNA